MVRRAFDLGLVLAIAVAISAIGCGKKDKGSNKKAPDKAGTKDPGEVPVKPVAPPPTKPKLVYADAGFETPESVLYDVANDRYLVSNINGSPFGEDDNGFISHLSPDGKVVALKWIDGASDKVTLNAPKGMAIAGGLLYVSDITMVRMFDLATGAAKGEIPIAGATFVNDVAASADGSEVYASDTGVKAGFEPSGTDAVYRIEDGKAVAIAKDAALNRPNGLLVSKAGLWIVTYGSNELYQVDSDGKKDAVVNLPAGGLDGIEASADGKLLVSSWEGSAIYIGPSTGPFTVLVAGVDAPADLGYDSKRNLVLLPRFKGNAVEVYAVE